MEKRKKLESFTHLRIGEEFIKLVQEYASKDPNAIIQAVVPLLIEINMQPIFHKLLLVYIPEEEQIKRLIERDGITREMAVNILNSQMPIEVKRGYCDFIIDNTGTIEETRKQVEELWEKLKVIQKGSKK
jgi:dephospho-CoA kinase